MNISTPQALVVRDCSAPYRVEGPAIISFSGGRSSRYMLHHILDANDGALPPDVHVVFCNTGKEFPETLDFVRDCEVQYGVRIWWLEYRYQPGATGEPGEHTFEIVGHNSASRSGEPFEAAIQARRMLPNPITRFCTAELKVKTVERFAKRHLGWSEWDSYVGFRHDEQRRVRNAQRRNLTGKDSWETFCPLDTAKVTKRRVARWSRAQPFDLALPSINDKTPMGNCDLCYLKGARTIMGIMRLRPESAEWWIRQERNVGFAGTLSPETAYFRADRPSYAALFDLVQRQSDIEDIDLGEDGDLPCGCHD